MADVASSLERCRESISHTGLGEDVARIERIGFDFPSDVCNVNTKVLLGIPVLPSWPYGRKELPVRHGLTGVSHEDTHELPFGGSKMNQRTIVHECASLQIH